MSSLLCSAFYLFKTFERLRPPFGAEINFQQSLFIGGGSPQNLRKLVRVGGLQLREKRPFVDHRGSFVMSVAMILGRGLATGLPAPVALFLGEKVLPDRFVGVTGFAFRMPVPHSFQCKQRAIVADIECACYAGNIYQPCRRRFFLEVFGRGMLGSIDRTNVDEAHAVEHIPSSA